MTGAVRLGAVDYLNARPLVYGIARDGSDLSVRFDLPVRCAALLAGGDIDLGLIPTIAYLDRPGDCIVPGVGIVSDGAVASVMIYTRRPIRDVRSLALDTSSRTSVALTKILCARVFEIAPLFVPQAPDLDAMLATCDAALMIGDPALFADVPAGVEVIDLGLTWTTWTGLPFVWAFWAGRATAADRTVVERLQEVRDAGVAASDAIADEYCAGNPPRQALARRYLREHIKYDMDERAIAGLRAYYREAAGIGLVERIGPLEFF